MTDATSNRFLGRGDTATMNAFVPAPATPASGPDQGYFWFNTDDNVIYGYDFVGVAWVNAAGGGTVTSVAAGVGLSASPSPIVGAGTLSLAIPMEPGGRLTLTSGTPVMSADVTGATTIYYALDKHAYVPIWDGTKTVPTLITELSQTTTDNTKSPAACVPNSNYDMFVWDDGGTKRCTRGPRWIREQTFTVTIASPAVVTAVAHGLLEGMPWVPTTTGALPTGMTAGTTYFVTTVPTADTFTFSATFGGSNVNTSGSQSGVHTATDSNVVRGTGAGTTQISRNTDGYYTNTVAITNGPGAGLGTYVGTIRTDGSSQCNMILNPSAGAGGTSNRLDVWNAYNQVPYTLQNNSSTDSWAYTLLTWRIREGNFASAVRFVIGLTGAHVHAEAASSSRNSTATINRHVAIGLDSSLTPVGGGSIASGNAGANAVVTPLSVFASQAIFGAHMLTPLEISVATGTCTWLGDDSRAGERWSPFNVTIMA